MHKWKTMDIKEFLSEWNNDDDCIEVKTSGSTGTPKKMRVLKSRMLSSARRTNDFFGLKKGDRTLLCMSLDYIAGKMMAVRAIERSLQMDVVEPCGHPLAHLPSFGGTEGGYDFIAMVPMQVWNTLHDEKERARLCETKQLLIGGGEISREMESLLAPLPCHSWSSYGMTETLSHIALRRIGSGLWYEPLSQVNLSLADDGCLIVNDEATWAFNMKTNDIAEFDADGIRFRILGRKDNVICSGGIKIQAEEVERIIADHFTLPFMITRKKDEKFGEVVVMVIESTERAAIGTARKVCQDFLPKYWQPRDYMTVEKLPRTETGKVKR